MNWTNLAKWALSVPALSMGVDFWKNDHVWNAMWDVIWATNEVLQVGNSLLNPLFATVAWWASAWLLTNSVLKDLWVEKNWVRYGLSWVAATAATLAGVAWWTALAPYLAAGWLSYAIWKHGWKYWKEALNRVAWTAWWLTWWVIAWWARSAWRWLKGEQFSWEWIWRLNPKF